MCTEKQGHLGLCGKRQLLSPGDPDSPGVLSSPLRPRMGHIASFPP